MRFPRSSGILLHITSLPSSFGVGDLGPAAREFVKFLQASGQKIWQILPLCPPAQGHSPYSSFSVFAGNPILISPEDMVDDGWATAEDLQEVLGSLATYPRNEARVDFENAIQLRTALLQKAFQHSLSSLATHEAFQAFRQANQYWLRDYATFVAISQHFDNLDWSQWPDEFKAPDSSAVAKFVDEHSDKIQYSEFVQFIFDQQWNRLKSECQKSGIGIYGDVPIFVDHQSADVWSNQSLFQLDEKGKPEFVAGVPPDYFSPTGQKWGNPLYRWDEMEKENYRWWVSRFRRSISQFDIVRVDHFRGFEAYWEIPGDAPNAQTGKWVQGPHEKPFEAAEKELGTLPIVAEDLGLITKEVEQLREKLGFPTMRVMQFGYSSEADNFHRPDQYPENCFAYTGTHDNETIVGWYQDVMTSGSEESQNLLHRFFDPTAEEQIELQLIRPVLNSQADCAIVPMQDYLGLGNEARMNVPATVQGNWQWRLTSSDRIDELVASIATLTRESQR